MVHRTILRVIIVLAVLAVFAIPVAACTLGRDYELYFGSTCTNQVSEIYDWTGEPNGQCTMALSYCTNCFEERDIYYGYSVFLPAPRFFCVPENEANWFPPSVTPPIYAGAPKDGFPCKMCWGCSCGGQVLGWTVDGGCWPSTDGSGFWDTTSGKCVVCDGYIESTFADCTNPIVGSTAIPTLGNGKCEYACDIFSVDSACDEVYQGGNARVGSYCQSLVRNAISTDKCNDQCQCEAGGTSCTPDFCNGNCPLGCTVSQDPDCGCQDGNGCCGIGCTSINDNDCGGGTGYTYTFYQSGLPTSGFNWGVTLDGSWWTLFSAGYNYVQFTGLTGSHTFTYTNYPGYTCTSNCAGTITSAGTKTATFVVTTVDPCHTCSINSDCQSTYPTCDNTNPNGVSGWSAWCTRCNGVFQAPGCGINQDRCEASCGASSQCDELQVGDTCTISGQPGKCDSSCNCILDCHACTSDPNCWGIYPTCDESEDYCMQCSGMYQAVGCGINQGKCEADCGAEAACDELSDNSPCTESGKSGICINCQCITCDDTDNSLAYETPGTCTGTTSGTDYCTNSTHLREYACQGYACLYQNKNCQDYETVGCYNGNIWRNEWRCSDGYCNAGATDTLIETCPDTCTDSDGNNPNSGGSVTDSEPCSIGQTTCPTAVTVQDSCYSSDVLTERTCSGNDRSFVAYNCSSDDYYFCSPSGSSLYRRFNDWFCSDSNPDYCSSTTSTVQTWTCGSGTECNLQSCEGTPYRCYRTNAGVWSWTSSGLYPEAACDDGYDNDCDGLTDLEDVADCGYCTVDGDCDPDGWVCIAGNVRIWRNWYCSSKNCVYSDSSPFDCDNNDGCSGNVYNNYWCSEGSCLIQSSDDCSDCSCSCGGYNTVESTANGNCADGKDNDCDGLTDSQDPGCASCGNGVVEGTEQCDPGADVPGDCCSASCQFETSSYTCRASAGSCDVAETCSGTSATCPSNSYLPSSTVCRASAGACDLAEYCTGSSASCPSDVFRPSSYACRASAGVCDVQETCTGSTAICPSDVKSTAQCRAAAGVCDVAENCDGVNNNCPSDVLRPNTYECRASAGTCDLAELCTGSSVSCPADVFRPSSYVCRAAAGDCDVQETCTGSSASCPSNIFKSSSTVCRVAAGVCDLAEYCTGSSATCPSNAFKTSSFVCDLYYNTDYGCPWGSYCGNDVGVSYQTRSCSGFSALCDGAISGFGSYSLYDDCSATECCADNDPTCNPCSCPCSDTDGGVNYYVGGICNSGTPVQDSCGAGNVLTERSCSETGCTQTTWDCDNDDNYYCSPGSPTLRRMFDDWFCSDSNPDYCSDSISTASTWTCGSSNSCGSQSCEGTPYRCYRTNAGVWSWRNASLGLPSETACSDGYDNDCDGLTDCNDTDCNSNPACAFCVLNPDGTSCGLCSVCSGGDCAGIPADDSDCGTIDCSGWYVQTGTESPTGTEYCYNKLDISSDRCEGLDNCKDPNTADCNSQSNDAVQYSCGLCQYIAASSCTGTTKGACTNYEGSPCGTQTCPDGCYDDFYRDYSDCTKTCSGGTCQECVCSAYSSQDCSDCSCTCGGYNVEEKAENNNCADGKDNDCDGLTDSQEPACPDSSMSFTGILKYSNEKPVANSRIEVKITNKTLSFERSAYNETDASGHFFVKIYSLPSNIMTSDFDMAIYVMGEVDAIYECHYYRSEEKCY